MVKKARLLALRAATQSDFEFAWKAWAEAVEPHIAPVISAKFKRSWQDDEERRLFSTWWQPKSSTIITLDDEPVGWLASEEESGVLTLINFVVLKKFRGLGIASIVIGAKLNEWSSNFRTVAHSVLKASGHASFFEHFGFRTIREDDIVFFMEANIA